MPVTDANGRVWQIPALTWDHIRRVNKVLRDSAEELCLPRDAHGPLCDLHHPAVQEWFNRWSPAVIIVATVLLSDQASGVNEQQFAAAWRGDPVDQLREAIWAEWILYLPPSAREPAEELRKTLTAQRAIQAGAAVKMIDLMETEGLLIVDQSVETLRTKLKSLGGLTSPTTVSGSPVSSDSTPAPGPTANSKRCSSRRRTASGKEPAGSSLPSGPAG